jgi:hypothetical protein
MWVVGYPGEDTMRNQGFPQVKMSEDFEDLNQNVNKNKNLVFYKKIQTTNG